MFRFLHELLSGAHIIVSSARLFVLLVVVFVVVVCMKNQGNVELPLLDALTLKVS